MGGYLTREAPIFFVCGTPTDRYGFDCTVLDGRQLPELRRYLDVLSERQFPKRGKPTYFLRRIATEHSEAAIFSEYRWIKPSDTEHNRGAYIAAGCWIESPLSTVEAAEALRRIAAIHKDLAVRRDPVTDAFATEFRLHAYKPPDLPEESRSHWADFLSRAACRKGCTDVLILTSEQVEQGELERVAATSAMSEPKQRRPADPVGSDLRRVRLQQALREAVGAAPGTRRKLRKLIRLEEERAKMIGDLVRSIEKVPRRTEVSKASLVLKKLDVMLLAGAFALLIIIVVAAMVIM